MHVTDLTFPGVGDVLVYVCKLHGAQMISQDLFAKRAETCASLLTKNCFVKKHVIYVHNFKTNLTELICIAVLQQSVKHYCCLSLHKACMSLH